MARTPDFEQLNEWNRLLRTNIPKVRMGVAYEFLEALGYVPTVTSVDDANRKLKDIVQLYLDKDLYLGMAVFLLGRDYFDERSVLVQDVFSALHNNDQNSIPGCSSASKTYSVVIWHVMDYLRDPKFTAIRIAALSDTTLRNNIFNNVRHALKSIVLDYGLQFGNLFIGLNAEDREACITGITYPPDSNETGRFKGIKPIARSDGKKHLQFGTKTRVRLILEEASNMPDSVIQELKSVQATIDPEAHGRTKITAIFNPYDLSHWTAKISEPEMGIASLDREKDHQWESRLGWHVTRLDGKRCENVVNKKTLIPCMLSYNAYRSFENEGENSVGYNCYARGFWPIAGSHHLLIPRYLLENRRCEPLFVSEVINTSTVDTAYIEDKTVQSSARWGLCSGLVWREKDGSQRREMFDALNINPHRRKPKKILWIEQLIDIRLPKRDSNTIGEAIRHTCHALDVKPDWLAIDSTGSGVDIFSWLCNNFGNVMGIQWANKATELQVLDNTEIKPSEAYDRISSEMWFVFKTWLENDVIFFSPDFVQEPVFTQLTRRRLPLTEKNFRGKLRVETKAEYKGHEGGVSPDHADSVVMLPQLIRTRSDSLPGMASTEMESNKRVFKSVHVRQTINGQITPKEEPKNPTFEQWLEKMGKY